MSTAVSKAGISLFKMKGWLYFYQNLYERESKNETRELFAIKNAFMKLSLTTITDRLLYLYWKGCCFHNQRFLLTPSYFSSRVSSFLVKAPLTLSKAHSIFSLTEPRREVALLASPSVVETSPTPRSPLMMGLLSKSVTFPWEKIAFSLREKSWLFSVLMLLGCVLFLNYFIIFHNLPEFIVQI